MTKRKAPSSAAEGASPPKQIRAANLKIVAFNVNGLRALLRHSDGEVLRTLVADEAPDLLFLSETKIDESVVPQLTGGGGSGKGAAKPARAGSDIRGFFGGAKGSAAAHAEGAAAAGDGDGDGDGGGGDLLEGYRQVWNHSTRKKGYSGTAVFLRRGCERLRGAVVSLDGLPGTGALPAEERARVDCEGRLISVRLEGLTVVHTYVPNAGQKLEKVGFRTETWDPLLFRYLRDLRTSGEVLWCGDLNVVRGEGDVSDFRRRRNRAPGCSDAERDSFGALVGGIDAEAMPTDPRQKNPPAHGQAVPGPAAADFVDVYRALHPYPRGTEDHEGYSSLEECPFTYWSARAGARQPNGGWRLDYFVASSARLDRVVDCRHHPRVAGSDHVPISIALAL